MQTLRYNAYNEIHKALRAELYDTALLLQQTDFYSEKNAVPAFKRINSVLNLFDGHAHHEDKHIMPLVKQFDEATYNTIESEHATDEALTHQLQNKMDAYENAATENNRIRIGNDIMYLFIEFVAFNLSHMNKEEHLINEILWANFTDEEILQVSNAIRAEISPQEMAQVFQLMAKGVSNLELIKMLTGMQTAMPPDVFEQFLKMTEAVLSPSRMERVNEGLKEDILFY